MARRNLRIDDVVRELKEIKREYGNVKIKVEVVYSAKTHEGLDGNCEMVCVSDGWINEKEPVCVIGECL